MALFAGDVKLGKPLNQALAPIATRSQGRLQDVIGRVSARNRSGQVASGRPRGEYADFALGQAGDIASRGIDDSLLGVLGNTSYKDTLSQRDHLQQVALAKMLGSMAKPSSLQEIVGGVGMLGNIIPAASSLYKSYKGRGTGPVPFGAASNPYGFDMDELRGFTPLENELWR